jgi:hypothetical protein
MGDVYKFAQCNLSATRASGGSYDGLFVDREPLAIKPLLIDISSVTPRVTPGGVKTQLYCIHRGFEEWTEVTNAPLINVYGSCVGVGDTPFPISACLMISLETMSHFLPEHPESSNC